MTWLPWLLLMQSVLLAILLWKLAGICQTLSRCTAEVFAVMSVFRIEGMLTPREAPEAEEPKDEAA